MSKISKRIESESAKPDPKKTKNEFSLLAVASKVKEFSKNFMEIEDKEVESRTGENDLKIYKETCSEVRKLMKDILQLKLSGKTDEETRKKILEKRIEASLFFVTLKKLNRIDKLRLKKARDTTHDAKQRVDSFHLQLENLLYEVFHLKKEVDKCLEFKSKDEDIELVPVEEFYQEAPSNISKMELTKSNQHKLTLARLEWEFEQRKRLSEQCRSLEQNREKASNEIFQKQKQLESLLPRLNSILESTRPLQEELNLPVERIKFQKELAALLPDPLYILHSQIKAFIEACDPSLQISIEGGMEDALNFGSKNKTGLDEILEDVDSAESDMEAEYETNKRTVTSNKMKTDWQLTRHPLRIQLTIERVVINFSYLTTLNIVAVDCKPLQRDDGINQPCIIDNLLSEIFPNDYGDESPSWVNCFQARSMVNGKINEQGKPYLWAQRLAGLDFNGVVKCTPQTFINTEFVETVIVALKNRINYRFQLVKVLHLLEKGELDLNQDSSATFPSTIYSRLVSWVPSCYEDCLLTSKNLEQLLSFLEINPKAFMFFKATVERESAKLLSVFLVPVDYPNSAPICSLELSWNGKHTRKNSEIIRGIEADVNVSINELPQQHKIDLLIVQLKKLTLHLDLITEIDGQLMKRQSGSWQSQSKPEFSAEKMIPQLIKGHNRTFPTKYDIGFETMDRIIHDLANSSAHLNYTRFLDLIADHERNPNQHPHNNWNGHPPGEPSGAGYELSAPKPGPSVVFPTSVTTADTLHAARSLALHDTPARHETTFKTLCFTELKPDNPPSMCQPSTSRRIGVKSEPLDNNSGTERTNPSKRLICGVCNLEMPETKFDDHRYAEHIGLARPYGMSQDFSDAEKRRELKRALLLMKQVSCPYCLRIFTSTLGFQYHQSRCEAEVGDSPKHIDCYLCGKQVAAFRAHMKIHLKEERQQLVKMLEETKIICCHYCDSKYSTLTGYLYHKDRCRFAPHPPLAPLLKKSNKRKEECEVCGKKVLVLKSHMKLHERALAKTE